MSIELPVENIDLQERDRPAVQKMILEKLHNAADSQARVDAFAHLVDTVGLDVLLSLIPGVGDAGASGLAGLYLICEAKKAGLSKRAYLKIIGLQAADFAIGVIPILGDVADYFFKATKWSAVEFRKKTAELVKKARKEGVSEADIAKITAAAEKLPRLVARAVPLMASKMIKGRLQHLKKAA